MHISEGILPAQVCAAGYAVSGGMTWYVLRQIKRTSNPHEELPKAAMLTAAFFVGSSINLPIPPASVHLVLNGFLGALLGWYSWPAILVGLLLQAMLLGHGGFTPLGINAFLMGLPALIAFGIYNLRHSAPRSLPEAWRLGLFSFLAGMVGLGLAACIFFSILIFAPAAELEVASKQQTLMFFMLAHIPLMFIEGGFTAMLAIFLRRVKPELVQG